MLDLKLCEDCKFYLGLGLCHKQLTIGVEQCDLFKHKESIPIEVLYEK